MPKAFSPQDHYFHLARKRGLRARSAFKLEEILQKFPHLLSPNAVVLDLGAAPGSFLQILSARAGNGGQITGVDLQPIDPLPRVELIQGDIFSDEIAEKLQVFLEQGVASQRLIRLRRTTPCSGFDLITADLAPKTSGISDVDQWKSVELNQRVLELCQKFLKPGGNLITKIFVGEDFQEFWKNEFQPRFAKARTFKPKACRERSFETYLIGERFQK